MGKCYRITEQERSEIDVYRRSLKRKIIVDLWFFFFMIFYLVSTKLCTVHKKIGDQTKFVRLYKSETDREKYACRSATVEAFSVKNVKKVKLFFFLTPLVFALHNLSIMFIFSLHHCRSFVLFLFLSFISLINLVTNFNDEKLQEWIILLK